MAAKDIQAREKAQSVEARHAALVGRTGTLESQVASVQPQISSLQSQIGRKADKASIGHPPGQALSGGWASGTKFPGDGLNEAHADIANLYAAVNALINAMNA